MHEPTGGFRETDANKLLLFRLPAVADEGEVVSLPCATSEELDRTTAEIMHIRMNHGERIYYSRSNIIDFAKAAIVGAVALAAVGATTTAIEIASKDTERGSIAFCAAGTFFVAATIVAKELFCALKAAHTTGRLITNPTPALESLSDTPTLLN